MCIIIIHICSYSFSQPSSPSVSLTACSSLSPLSPLSSHCYCYQSPLPLMQLIPPSLSYYTVWLYAIQSIPHCWWVEREKREERREKREERGEQRALSHTFIPSSLASFSSSHRNIITPLHSFIISLSIERTWSPFISLIHSSLSSSPPHPHHHAFLLLLLLPPPPHSPHPLCMSMYHCSWW